MISDHQAQERAGRALFAFFMERQGRAYEVADWDDDVIAGDVKATWIAEAVKIVDEAVGVEHFVVFDLGGWSIEHPFRCRQNGMTDCDAHRGIEAWAKTATAPPLGRWLLRGFDEHGTPALDWSPR